MQNDLPRVRISAAAVEMVHKGFLWVYRDRVRAGRDVGPGALVAVESPQDQIVGFAHYSDRSKIALRLLTRGSEPPDEAKLLADRLERARALRDRLLPNRTGRRLVYSEADGLPGVIVDQYADAVVLQTLTQAMERCQERLVALLQEQLSPRQIVIRNEAKIREFEGLAPTRRAIPETESFEVEIREGNVRQWVDLWDGQKTGTFLDQQDNHVFAGKLARGRVLDLFTYTGGFALHAAANASEVIGVDSSRTALARAERSAELSGFSNLSWVCENVFDFIRDAGRNGELFDTIFVDPPAFAKRKSDLPAALRAYRDLNRRAMALLAPGGVFVTCSCSYNLGETDFIQIVRQAAESVGRSMVLLERRSQSIDHPEALGLVESRYLKCLVLASR